MNKQQKRIIFQTLVILSIMSFLYVIMIFITMALFPAIACLKCLPSPDDSIQLLQVILMLMVIVYPLQLVLGVIRFSMAGKRTRKRK